MFTAEIKPQRRDERRGLMGAFFSALIASLRLVRSPAPLARIAPIRLAQHHSAKTLFQRDRVEVDQQAKLPASQAQLAEQLSFMHRLNREHRARLYYNAPAGQQLDFIRSRQRSAFKCTPAKAGTRYGQGPAKKTAEARRAQRRTRSVFL